MRQASHTIEEFIVDVVGHQSLELLNGMSIVNMGEGVFEPRKDIDLVMLAGFNEGEEYCTGMSTLFISTEEPIFSANNKGFNGSFRAIIINIKPPIIKVGYKRLPMI